MRTMRREDITGTSYVIKHKRQREGEEKKKECEEQERARTTMEGVKNKRGEC